MDFFSTTIMKIVGSYGMVTTFAVLGIMTIIATYLSKNVLKGRIDPSALAVIMALILAYIGGAATGGKRGISDVTFFAGMGFVGGGMWLNYTLIATAYGAKLEELKKAGLAGGLALVVGTIIAFVVGALAAYAAGYRDAVSLTTIGAGAATFAVGPVTGAALGATSDVIALSIAAGVVKSVSVMILTPFLAKPFGLTTPAAAMVYGGLVGTTSGTSAGLAATDARLVPYGATTATFYTGFGCLVCPSIGYFAVLALTGG
ncbi:malonate transporter subunit MadM [Breoghania sp.]|uniref:malonate transporter subunit MadM n=1 Tax=Breoghania sp. TaxID=2065378 RepID=UPI002AA88E3F|nr:malonate transporter subunit MadM [Breoghania sp.]